MELREGMKVRLRDDIYHTYYGQVVTLGGKLPDGLGGYIYRIEGTKYGVWPEDVAEIVEEPAGKGWLAGTSTTPNTQPKSAATLMLEHMQQVLSQGLLWSKIDPGQCECGKEKHNFEYHSTWCPKYTRPME